VSSELRRRGPLLLLGAAALVTGAWAGLARLGAVATTPASPMDHGPLMVSGFLGTVIALERAVAARTTWAMLAPALCGAGAVALLAGQPFAGAVLLSAGSALVVAVQLTMLRGGAELHLVVLTLAAASWLAGNVLLAMGRAVFDVVPFWLVFLVGTIAAERLELNRVLPRTPFTRASFLLGLGLLVGGAVLGLAWRDAGMRVLGAGALALAAWMLRFDVARRTIRQSGAVRYIAAALLAGYAWLGVAGALALAYGHPMAGPRYDALLHSVLVGFVFSMIFGHALVIVPAVLGLRVPFRERFYVHLGLLHLSLIARLAGDFSGLLPLRQAGAWANVAAIALFLASTALAAASRTTGPAPASPHGAPRAQTG